MTAGLFGHSHPVLAEAIATTTMTTTTTTTTTTTGDRGPGLSLGATTAAEARLARLVCARFGLGRLRFTNSGTEANLHALAAARRHTGRRAVVVFGGGYHGSVLSFGDPLPLPPSAGDGDGDGDGGNSGIGGGGGGGGGASLYGAAENTVDRDTFVVLRYNDCGAVRRAFASAARGPPDKRIAAVLVEGMLGAGGFIPATREFLLTIQEECEKVCIVTRCRRDVPEGGGDGGWPFPPLQVRRCTQLLIPMAYLPCLIHQSASLLDA